MAPAAISPVVPPPLLFTLQHVPERERALQRLDAAVKPGGWLVVEDVDILVSPPDQMVEPRAAAAYEKALAGSAQFIQSRGGDMRYGRRLYRDMCALGLQDVAAEGRVPMIFGGAPMAEIARLSFQQLGQRLIDAGALSSEELDLAVEALASASFFATGILTMAVWGRKPPS
jgi:hypothetical protein